jgi:hypothetical protein
LAQIGPYYDFSIPPLHGKHLQEGRDRRIMCAYSAKVGTGFAIRIRAKYSFEHFLTANRFPLSLKMLADDRRPA